MRPAGMKLRPPGAWGLVAALAVLAIVGGLAWWPLLAYSWRYWFG